MTEVNELTHIRQANILKLVADMGPGMTAKQVSKKLGMKYATYATVIRLPPRANIGSRVSDTIETALNLGEGWLDRDRRGGKTPAGDVSANTLSMDANGYIVQDKPISNHQANEIMRLLLDE